MNQATLKPPLEPDVAPPPQAPSEDSSLLSDIVEWDVRNWGRSIRMWDSELRESWQGRRALDLGAGGGGLSLYLSLRGCRVAYCDFQAPRPAARELFGRYDLTSKLEYCRANVTVLPFGDGSFDLVGFKSLLASVGKFGGLASQKSVFDEAYRVLRPGGYLLFAENAHGSAFHAFCRDRFVAWGHDCRYPALAELQEFLSPFSEKKIETYGLVAALGRREWQRRALSYADALLSPLFSEDSRYLAYGYARK